jgi:hypothetical protein
MPAWAKVLLRIMGLVNAAALLLGTFGVAEFGYTFLKGRMQPSESPYFALAFATMTIIELGFATVLFVTAVRFVQARLAAASLYSLTVAALFIYWAAVAMLWRAPMRVALPVAGATAVSNATIFFEELLLVPFLYPLITFVMVQFLTRRYSKSTSTADCIPAR